MSTIRELRGDDVAARDGIVGSFEDVYFDDERWTVRYLVVDTGGPGRRLLLPPAVRVRRAHRARQLQGVSAPDARAGQAERRAFSAPLTPRMVEHHGKPVGEQVQRAIDEELVPLSIAATVTHFHLMEARTLVEDAPSLSRALILTAIALSQVVQIRVRAAEAPRSMSAREVCEQLFVPA